MDTNILIVEDNYLVAEDLKQSLEKNNFNVVAIVDNAEEAIIALKTFAVDLVLIDIVINGKISGIELAEIIHLNYQIPFIYVTSNSDKKTISKALVHKPKSYIIKPFTEIDIFTNVQLALDSKKEVVTQTNQTDTTSMMIKVDCNFVKIKFDALLFVKAEGNYLKFETQEKEYVTRMKLKECSDLMPSFFVQIHKSYIVNTNFITFFNAKLVHVAHAKLPVGRAYKEVLQQF